MLCGAYADYCILTIGTKNRYEHAQSVGAHAHSSLDEVAVNHVRARR